MLQIFETLEPRQLFAAGQSIQVVVNGTGGNDTVLLAQTATQLLVTVNGSTTAHDLTWIIASPNQNIPPQKGWISGVVVHGGAGNDNLKADASVTLPVTIAGEEGRDTIFGGSGDDTLYAGYIPAPFAPFYTDPVEWIQGGKGNDKLYAAGDHNYLYGEEGNDLLEDKGHLCELHGGEGDDTLNATYYGEFLYGDEGNDTINGSAFNYIEGGSGDDTINGKQYLNTIYGGDGNDYINIPDTLGGNSDGSYVDSGAGDDTINTGVGPDTIYGGLDNDVINAGDGDNDVAGQGGNDSIAAGAGNDSLSGDDGNDTLNGGNGSNKLWGLGGNDYMTAGGYADAFYGGSGTDTVSYSNRAYPVKVTLDGQANDGGQGEFDQVNSDVENVYGGHGNDTLVGSAYNNYLVGGDGYDSISGGSGNDTIHAGNGNDTISGDNGDDVLYGEGNDDSMYGGFGNDSFYGGDGRDTLIAIGGGDHDKLYGQGGEDSFWMDGTPYENYDGSASEIANRRNHIIVGFINTLQRDPNGASLDDPSCDTSKSGYTNNNALATLPLFSIDGPKIDDINQRNLGDCYFLATVASIAKVSPDRIRESIIDMGDHTFAVRFTVNGKDQYYRVDDDCPIVKGGTSLYYAGTGIQGSIWVPMLEKAFVVAKKGFNGNYEAVSGGYSEDVFPLFGCKPTKFGNWASATSLGTIAGQLALGKAVTTNSDWGSFDVGDHVVLNHVYTVISVDLAKNTITLRNPWGSDAGRQAGAWVQGANDGYVTFTAKEFADNFGSTWAAYA